jgi:hypothetical protein
MTQARRRRGVVRRGTRDLAVSPEQTSGLGISWPLAVTAISRN